MSKQCHLIKHILNNISFKIKNLLACINRTIDVPHRLSVNDDALSYNIRVGYIKMMYLLSSTNIMRSMLFVYRIFDVDEISGMRANVNTMRILHTYLFILQTHFICNDRQ